MGDDSNVLNNRAIDDFLDVVKKEYDNERVKKQSFETRAGFIITIISAIYAFIMDKVEFSEIQAIIDKPLYFMGAIKIIVFILIYISIIFTIYSLIMVIYTKEHKIFETEGINGEILALSKMEGKVKIIGIYKEIIKDHREKNKTRAKYLNFGFIGIVSNLVLISIYVNFV